jgi:hypothetical protein
VSAGNKREIPSHLIVFSRMFVLLSGQSRHTVNTHSKAIPS